MPIARLADRAVVRVQGPDARALLHNVLTADMGRVDAHGSAYGALLTPQGKILFDFILHRLDEGYAVDIRADQGDHFVKRLMLYRLRSKADISAAPDLSVFAQWGEPSAAPADPRLAALGSRWVAPASNVTPDAEPADWDCHRIGLAIPEGGVDFVFGDTFPHDAAMDSLSGVAFDKGCYIGQEVVSRMRHRGTARRRIVAVAGNGALPAPGAEIMAGDRPLGRLGSSAGDIGIGLIRLDRARTALDAGQRLNVDGQDVTVELPGWATYDWPSGQAAAED
jgi:folate-binding protein YgfZ